MTSRHHTMLRSEPAPDARPTHACDAYQVDREFAVQAAREKANVTRYVCSHGRDIIVRGPAPERPVIVGKRCARCGNPSGERRFCEPCLSTCAACGEAPRKVYASGATSSYCASCESNVRVPAHRRARKEVPA